MASTAEIILGRKMEIINRTVSPMNFVDEGIESVPDEVEEAKERFEREQGEKPPVVIGSIDDINRRMGNLDRRLQKCTMLVVESRLSDFKEYLPSSARGRERYKNKGVLTNVRKTSRSTGRSSVRRSAVQGKQTATGKPKFVELYQYAGYEPDAPTPLPDDMPAENVLQKVLMASSYLQKKDNYRSIFKKWFFSDMSQDILLDTFWYFFLEKFQHSRGVQERLFDRVAENYVYLLMYANNPHYRNTFFQDYPLLLSQAVYTTFCHGFPDSYMHYGEVFKDDLVSLVYEWTVGLKPSPRAWLKWNFKDLEPNITIRGNNSKTSKQKNLGLTMEQLDSLIVKGRCSSTSAVSSSSWRRIVSASLGRVSRRTQLVDVVTVAQAAARSESIKQEFNTGLKKSEDPLGLIKKRQKRPLAESHPACRGPEFAKGTFDIYGCSPLVRHFLRLHHLEPDSGTIFRITRTDLEKLPPIGTPTYREVIRESFAKIKQFKNSFTKMYAENQKRNLAFSQRQMKELKQFKKNEAALLSRTKEVRRLSNLIILEQKLHMQEKGTSSVESIVRKIPTLQTRKELFQDIKEYMEGSGLCLRES